MSHSVRIPLVPSVDDLRNSTSLTYARADDFVELPSDNASLKALEVFGKAWGLRQEAVQVQSLMAEVYLSTALDIIAYTERSNSDRLRNTMAEKNLTIISMSRPAWTQRPGWRPDSLRQQPDETPWTPGDPLPDNAGVMLTCRVTAIVVPPMDFL